MTVIGHINDGDGGVDATDKINLSIDEAEKVEGKQDLTPMEDNVAISTISASTYNINMAIDGDITGNVSDGVLTLTLSYTLGGDVTSYKRRKDFEINNSGNTSQCLFYFSGIWEWVENTKPNGIAIGARGLLTIETRTDKVLASYVTLGG